MNDTQDKIARGYSRLEAIRQNVSEINGDIDENYAHQYNQLVSSLEIALDTNLTEFKADQINRIQISATAYSQNAFCKRAYFLTKVDGLLNYFRFSLGVKEEIKTFGFIKE